MIYNYFDMTFFNIQCRIKPLKFSFLIYGPFRNFATRKRFYKNTGIIQNDNKWEITLDNRRVKTPGGQVLVVNSEPLARAIAAEWDAQTDIISQSTMHLTALCNTAIDNPGKLTVHDITSYLLEYLATDTLLFHSDEEEELHKMQKDNWLPILDWFSERFGAQLVVSHGLDLPPISTEVRATLARHFLSYDFPSLNAMCFGMEALKSPVLMLACTERRLQPSDAVQLARLEEEFQLLQWGRVPWAHELSQAELTARVAAAALVLHCSNDSHSAANMVRQGQRTAQ